MQFDIPELIYKSISKTISEKENAILQSWLANPKNREVYQKRIFNAENIKDKISLYANMDTDTAYKRIEPRLTSRPIRYLQVLKYAAIFLALLTTGYFFQKNYQNFNGKTPDVLQIVNEKIILLTDDGLVKTIDEKASTELTDEDGNVLGIQNGTQLVYNNNLIKESLAYNTLQVPYGKRFELILSDGTKVHLNAGTSLKYPVKFLKNGNRRVFLDGEAYFDVVKSKTNPFIVNADVLNIKVLGTKFNVNSYPENSSTDVVLVEGAVGMHVEEKQDQTILKPGQRGAFNKTSTNINIQKVNTSSYTAWMNGELVFREIPFDHILKRLERHYNVSIRNENTVLGKEFFNASFLNQPIENVLIYFNEAHEIDYSIENNEIIIK